MDTENLNEYIDLEKIKKQKLILNIGLISFSVWIILNVLSIVMLAYSVKLEVDPLLSNVLPALCAILYSLLLFMFAEYLRMFAYKAEHTVLCIIISTIIIAAILNFVFIYNFAQNGFSEDFTSFTKIYSVSILFTASIQNILIFALGIMFIINEYNGLKELKFAGFAFIFKVFTDIIAYFYQTIALNLGMADNQLFVLVVASIIRLIGFVALGLSIIYLFVNLNKIESESKYKVQ